MRRALNENPMVQMAVIGIVGVILAFMLFTTVIKKDEPPPTAADGSAAATDPAAATSAAPTEAGGADTAAVEPGVADPAAAAPVTPVPVDPAATVPPATAAGTADGLLPTKGLPKDLLIAYAKDKAIALLIIDPRGISDRQIKAYTERLSSQDAVEVFVVDVNDIADYSRITSGVAVSRAPALVAIRPRKLTENIPTATVSYGFRSPGSVEQALQDALYDGAPVSAYP